MPFFEYRVKTRSGETKTGVIEGSDVRAAEAELLQEGYYIIGLQKRGEVRISGNPFKAVSRYLWNPLFGGASTFELAVFYRQLAAMLRSGITVIQSMRLLSEQGESPRVRKIALDSVSWLEEGGKLSDSFARYPWMFSNLQISILRAGELSGDLEGSTSRIAHYLEWENSLRQKIKIATLYPKILVAAVIFLPKIYVILTVSFAAYLQQTLPSAIGIVIGVIVLWVLYRWLNQIPPAQEGMDMVKLNIPKVGGMVKRLALAKFYRSFSAMYSAGVPLHQGLEYSAEAVGNSYLTKRLKGAIPRLDQGYTLVDCLTSTGVLPQLAVDMLTTGKATGNVDEMLDKLAEYTENDAEVSVIQTTVILGVLLFLILAGVIGTTVVRFYSGHIPQM